MSTIQLRGSTWDHTRGYDPLVATAAAYNAAHPDVEIIWEKRTLHEFGAARADLLADKFDLIVLDHPWAGFIASSRKYYPLDELLPAATLAALAAQSVGPSHRSYEWDGHQWALAIDAATLVASYRPDLLERLNTAVPRTWDEVLQLAQRARSAGQAVAIPLGAVDAISTFLTLGDNVEARLFADGEVIDAASGVRVLRAMRELAKVCHPDSYQFTPISMMEQMSTSDGIVYCPMAYGYNNYARPSYRANRCRYANIPALGEAGPRGSHIGGTGLAIARRCAHPEAAADYAAHTAGAAWQRTIYFDAGGQPGNAVAWDDARVNAGAGNFFVDTRESIERAYLRPRYNGYIDFQYPAGAVIMKYLQGAGGEDEVFQQLNAMYRDSMKLSGA